MSSPKSITSPRIVLVGPPDMQEGYHDLEEHERNQMHVAIEEQTQAVSLWYRALTLYRREMCEGWDFSSYALGSLERSVKVLQMQLLAIGISAAKSSLDDLLAGYYSQAYAGIRHLLEMSVQCVYLQFNPDEYELWYEQEGGIDEQEDPPGMQEMCQIINAEPEFKHRGVLPYMDRVYNSWQVMSKGAHPSGVGIRQTSGDDPGICLFGATYQEGLILSGFDIGLFTLTGVLRPALKLAKPHHETLDADWDRLADDVIAWHDAHEAKIRAAEGEKRRQRAAKTLPRPVPQVSDQALKRCRNLMQRRIDQMNYMAPPETSRNN